MTYGVKDLCKRFAVGEHTVLGWIRQGELKAVNVARGTDRRPHWRISQEALSAFEERRAAKPPVPRAPRRKRPEQVTEFYK
jgi:excisionase family DNA binding protein